MGDTTERVSISFCAFSIFTSKKRGEAMRLNGETVLLEQEQTLSAFLMAAQVDCKTIAVERNGVIVPKAEYERLWLSEEDTLEIVRFVGGG